LNGNGFSPKGAKQRKRKTKTLVQLLLEGMGMERKKMGRISANPRERVERRK